MDPSVINNIPDNYLSDENFMNILKENERIGSNFKDDYENLKSICVSKIDIKALNKVLYITKRIMEQHSISSNEATLRLMLFSVSILYIILDMLHMKYKSISEQYSFSKLIDGIKYGDDINKIKQFAEIISKITHEKFDVIYKQLLEAGSANISILEDGIIKNNKYFEYALYFNKLALNKGEVIEIENKYKSKIYILCDYFNIKRTDFQL